LIKLLEKLYDNEVLYSKADSKDSQNITVNIATVFYYFIQKVKKGKNVLLQEKDLQQFNIESSYLDVTNMMVNYLKSNLKMNNFQKKTMIGFFSLIIDIQLINTDVDTNTNISILQQIIKTMNVFLNRDIASMVFISTRIMTFLLAGIPTFDTTTFLDLYKEAVRKYSELFNKLLTLFDIHFDNIITELVSLKKDASLLESLGYNFEKLNNNGSVTKEKLIDIIVRKKKTYVVLLIANFIVKNNNRTLLLLNGIL